MKKLIALLTLLLSISIFGNTSLRKIIQVKGTGEREITPSKAKISFEIITEDENLEKATQLNSKVLEKYKSLLKKENLNYEKINSSDYNTNKYYNYKNTITNKGEKEYKTTLNVEISNLNLNNLKKIISILYKNKVYSIKKKINKKHYFDIISIKKTSKEAKNEAMLIYNNIITELKENNISTTGITLTGFINDEINLEKIENKKKEIYNVSHQFEIETRDLEHLGKFIDLATSLNISIPYSFISYDIDNKEILEYNLYKEAYENAHKKANTILGKTGLNLKNPITITDNSKGKIDSYVSYFNKIYNNDTIITKDNIVDDNSIINEKTKKYNTKINIQKQKFIKTVYIEFEMD